ncbi:hypothetical protein E3N88_24701 [Mikania micrantha]|uniref:non-specific serine/threonine protein kinase n=1 Tax=Mikania micrantha TaxID=192012 RepID=A0A5N6N3Y1_9ASTR|nr:hypothetical protein E3N88_24701 [Mikania micrantha]
MREEDLTNFLNIQHNLTHCKRTDLKGAIPSSYAALTKLEDLRIGDLNGEDSTLNFLVNLTSLSILSLRSSQVNGEIQSQIGMFPNLQSLDLSFNKLTRSIPNSFQDSQSLHFLYLGSNMLTGEIPSNIITPQLRALDASFNAITGNLPANFDKVGRSLTCHKTYILYLFYWNVVGILVNGDGLLDGKAPGISQCLQSDKKCTEKFPINSFAVKCGDSQQISSDGAKFDDNSETLGASSIYTSSNNNWAVSNTGSFISNPNGPQYTAQTASQIIDTLDSELYKTARISPNSLRYYGLGLRMEDIMSNFIFLKFKWIIPSHGEALGERVVQDFNIKKEAGGSKRALVKLFEANVTNTNIDIHIKWAGKGTCCIPVQSTLGLLVSAIRVSQVSNSSGSSNDNKRVGIAIEAVSAMALNEPNEQISVRALIFETWKQDKERYAVGMYV